MKEVFGPLLRFGRWLWWFYPPMSVISLCWWYLLYKVTTATTIETAEKITHQFFLWTLIGGVYVLVADVLSRAYWFWKTVLRDSDEDFANRGEDVELERGKPVIYDHIVTRDQLERHAAGGLWNLPKGAVKYNGKELPQMDSLSAAFVDQFNGPDLTKVRRR